MCSRCHSSNGLLHSKACSHVSRVCIMWRVKQNSSNTLTYSTRRTWHKILQRNISEPTSGLKGLYRCGEQLVRLYPATWTTVHLRHFYLIIFVCSVFYKSMNCAAICKFFSRQCMHSTGHILF